MARAYTTVVDTLITRTRHGGGIAVTQDFATKILSLCQQIVNVATREITGTATVTLTADTLFYELPTLLPNALDVIDVKDSSGRHLIRCKSIYEFSTLDTHWYTATGSRFEAWYQISRDYLIVYPAQTSGQQVTVDYVTATTIRDNYSALSGINMDLPDDKVDLALKLAETVLMIRARDTSLLKENFNSLMHQLELHNGLQ